MLETLYDDYLGARNYPCEKVMRSRNANLVKLDNVK